MRAAGKVASKTSARNREMRKYVNFAMLAVFLKVLCRIDKDPADSTEMAFLEDQSDARWEAVASQLFKMIDQHFRKTAVINRPNGPLTIVNYSKNSSFMADLLKEKIPLGVISCMKSLVK